MSLRLATRCVAACLLAGTATAGQKAFQMGGTNAVLQEATSEAGVLFTAMRFDRAASLWKVEASITNKSATELPAPLLLLVESFTGTTGPVRPDGLDNSVPPKGWYDLSATLAGATLLPGQRSASRTLSLGTNALSETPRLTVRVFFAAPGTSLALTHSLNEVGQPLGGVSVVESGPRGLEAKVTDLNSGVVTVGQERGEHSWEFSAPGYLSAWRKEILAANALTVVPSPRLVNRSTNRFALTPLDGGRVTNSTGSIEVVFPAGAVASPGSATLTPLTGQTLPGLLPMGWSPLQAFAIELSAEPAVPVTANLRPWGPIQASEAAALARWNPAILQWEVTGMVSGNGGGPVSVALQAGGSYALVVPDASPTTPPVAEVGQPLHSAAAPAVEYRSLSASGKVEPSYSPASKVPEMVTAQAQVMITNTAGPLASGLLLRCEVQEQYGLRNGARLAPAPYESYVVAYHRPGAAQPAVLRATFPLRPILLFAGEELEMATVRADVLPPGVFSGGVIDATGGAISDGGVQVLAGAGDISGRQAARLHELATTNFLTFEIDGITVSRAFDLDIAGVAAGRHLAVRFSSLPGNALFVLARLLSREGWYGLEPVERLGTDASGTLSSLEPSSGEKLPGITSAGRFVLLQVDAAQGLVSGIAKDAQGRAAAGLAVRISGRPWLTFSDAGGAFRLVAPRGGALVTLTDSASGNTGTASVNIPDVKEVTTADVQTSATGPRVAGLTPADGATSVPRVTAVVVQFSKPVNPGGLVGGGIRLVGPNDQEVAANLTLNLAGTAVTLLPNAQLAGNTLYTVLLSADIADAAGLRLEGPAVFTFTTASDLLQRDPNARLISFEPVDGNTVVAGTPGLAEPEAPVIIVNETSGRTATVLARPDGSFTNSIEADVDDRLSAVLVNRNGTRNTVPLSRQIFRDGSVGLFDSGGVVEAQGENGPIRLTVDPGSLIGRTRFKIDPVPMEELRQLQTSTPPADNAQFLGALKFSKEGGESLAQPHLSIGVDVAAMGLGPGESPSNQVYALCQVTEIGTNKVYSVLDTMQYEDGKLVTHSPPFQGLDSFPSFYDSLVIAIRLPAAAGRFVIVGVVAAVPENKLQFFTTDSAALRYALDHPSSVFPVGGAVVTLNRMEAGLQPLPGVQPGAFVTTASRAGKFAMLATFDIFRPGTIQLTAFSSRLLNLQGYRVLQREAFDIAAAAEILIGYPVGPGGAPDTTPPRISPMAYAPSFPVGAPSELSIVLRDDLTMPTFSHAQLEPAYSANLESNQPLSSADVSYSVKETEVLSGTSLRVKLEFTGAVRSRARFTLFASDAAGNSGSVPIDVGFGPPPAPVAGTLKPSSTNDTIRPMVASVLPGDGVMLTPGDPIEVRFTEAVALDSTNGVAITGPGAVRTPVWSVLLSPNQRMMRIVAGALSPGVEYTLTLGSAVKDLNGNSLDQEPGTPALDPFEMRFKTPPDSLEPLAGASSPVGTVVHKNYAFTVDTDRVHPGKSTLLIHRLASGFLLVNRVDLPEHARALALIPEFSFKRTTDGAVETRPLLAVVGGGAGLTSLRWLRLFDVSEPEDSAYFTSGPGVVGRVNVTANPYALPVGIKFSPPRLAIHLNTPDGGIINLVNLQAFILGANAPGDFWVRAGTEDFRPGIDLNGDGDYVDENEVLPLPQRNDLFGLERIVVPEYGRDINDFDIRDGGGYLVGALAGKYPRPERLQVFNWDGEYIGNGSDESGGLELANGRAFRVVLDPDLPIVDSLGPRTIPAAIIGGGSWLRVADLTVPEKPVLLAEFEVGSDGASIFTITRSGSDEYVIGTRTSVWTVRRSGLYAGATALVGYTGLPTVGRSMGIADDYFVGPSGGGLNVVGRPPKLRFVSAPTQAVTNMSALVGMGRTAVSNWLSELRQPTLLLPVQQRDFGAGEPQGIWPADPTRHYYVLVNIPGDVGSQLSLTLESLDDRGRLLPPRGALWPPVILTGSTNEIGYAEQQPKVAPIPAYRLSDDSGDPFYNLFASEPFALVREPLSVENRMQLAFLTQRQVIWTGGALRASLDPGMLLPSPFDAVVSKVNLDRSYSPGVNCAAYAFTGEFIPNPNPSLASPPRFGGVDLQNGAYRTRATEFYVQGRHQPLVFTRSYESRTEYYGPLGRGWDFNWNMRLVPVPEGAPKTKLVHGGSAERDQVANTNDVMLVNGDGRLLLFKHISEEAGNTDKLPVYANDPAIREFKWTGVISDFYLSPKGEYSVLYKFQDGGWVNVSPAGVRTYFRSDGKLERVVGAYEASQLTCVYRDDGKLDLVKGDRNLDLRFGYYQQPGSSASVPYDRFAAPDRRVLEGLIARVQVHGLGGVYDEVSFFYDKNGCLTNATTQAGVETIYKYDPNPPYQMASQGRGDGTEFHGQQITYKDGLVEKLTQDKQTITFSGARQTAADRAAAGSSSVSLGGARSAVFGIDNRGSVANFAGLPRAADDEGRVTRASSAEVTAWFLRDTNNPVYRFRNNVIASGREGQPSFNTTNTYDSSAWNRIATRTTANGVLVSNVYHEASGVLRSVEEITGSVVSTSTYNEYGQLQKHETKEDGHSLVRDIAYSPNTMLAVSEVRGGSAALTYSQHMLGGVDAFTSGGITYSNSYNSDRQVTQVKPAGTGAKLPSAGIDYLDGFIKTNGVSSGSDVFGQSFTYQNNRVSTAETTESGLPADTLSYSYDGYGRVQAVTTSLGETTTLSYDGPRTAGVRGPGVATYTTYRNGLPEKVSHQGITNTLAYDSEKRLASIERAGLTTAYTYNRGVQVASKTVADGSRVYVDETYDYDAAGRLEKVTPAGTDAREFEYFGDGQVRKRVFGGLTVYEATRDAAGNVLSAVIPNVAEYAYSDPDSRTGRFQTRRLSLWSTLGGAPARTITTELAFDALGRAVTSTLPCGSWQFEYDAFGNLVKRTDPDGVSWSRKYSPGGLLLTAKFTDSTGITNTYDARGRMLASGLTTRSYSGADKLLESVRWPDGTLSQFSSYNSYFMPEQIIHGSMIQQRAWENGRLKRVVSGPSILSYEYDGLGRMTNVDLNGLFVQFAFGAGGQVERETASSPRTLPRAWQASYLSRGRLDQEIYPSSFAVQWHPNDFGLPTQAPNIGIDSIEWVGPDVLYAVNFTGGTRVVRDLDDSLRATGIRYLKGPLTSPQTNAAFIYKVSAAGRILSETRVHEDGRSDFFDRAGKAKGMRVTGFYLSGTNAATGDGAQAKVTGLSFDPDYGEMSGPASAPGADPRSILADVDLVDGIVRTAATHTVTYTTFGAVEQVPLWVRLPGHTSLTVEPGRLSYDGLGMVSEVIRGAGAEQVTIKYTRDGMGRIIMREVTGPVDRCHPGVRQYVWRGRLLIEEYDQAGSVFGLVRRYFYIGQELAVVQAAQSPGGAMETYIPLVALNGSVGGYMLPNGQMREVILYGPYGTPVFKEVQGPDLVERETSAIAATLLFQGAWFDDESGLYQLGQRNLHPVLARFLQRDSALYVNSASMYAAFNGDPAGQTDTYGTAPEDVQEKSNPERTIAGFLDQVSEARDLVKQVRDLRIKPPGNWGEGTKAGAGIAATGLNLAKASFDAMKLASSGQVSELADGLSQTTDVYQNAIEATLTAFEAHELYKARQLGGDAFLEALELRKEETPLLLLERTGPGASRPFKLVKFATAGPEVDAKDVQHIYRLSQTANMLKIGKGVTALTGALIGAVGEKSENKENVKRVFDDLSYSLDRAEKFYSASKDMDAARCLGELKPGAIAGTWRVANGALAVVGSFQVGQSVGTASVGMLSDPLVAKAYAADVRKFEDNGGWTAVAGGFLSSVGLDRAGYEVGRFAEWSFTRDVLAPAVDDFVKSLKPDDRLEWYFQGLEAR